ncbi:hypothetical protein [Burkholderia territorii]|uniref:hypothetical protein n=1 Tax=Burkholderia territorii TaxID=1503055 RepID=UPI000B02F1A9|nr:hypothetical protein [Burkholderia territorii]
MCRRSGCRLSYFCLREHRDSGDRYEPDLLVLAASADHGNARVTANVLAARFHRGFLIDSAHAKLVDKAAPWLVLAGRVERIRITRRA